MKCYRKTPRISYRDHVTNEEVRAKIQQAVGPQEDLLTIVKRRKLKWYRHVARLSGLANARHSERAKKARQTEKEVRRHQGLASSPVPGGQRRTEKNGGKLL